MDVYVAGRDCAAYYDAAALDAADAARLARHPRLVQGDDWRVSRFVKQQLPADGRRRSLSHSHGVALCLCGSGALGADVEKLRPRDFAAWHGSGIVHAHEQRWLAQQGDDLLAYYVLWTLKEALIKATDGGFADLGVVGLRRINRQWRLHGGGRTWQGGAWRLSAEYVAACVWQGTDGTMAWHGWGQWQGLTAQPLLRLAAV